MTKKKSTFTNNVIEQCGHISDIQKKQNLEQNEPVFCLVKNTSSNTFFVKCVPNNSQGK